ncbi:MAG: hypothetical protein RBS56_04630 [Candidatus Gracilibacteria bacterium]|jgi:hypothetical protein|nr:hypothetical protein [Candidatus Gracilibacteria bacterium]
MQRKIFIALAMFSLFILSSCSGFEYTLDETNQSDNKASISEEKEEPTNPEIEILSTESTEVSSSEEKEEPSETKVEVIENDEVLCMELYAPVCGMVQGNCENSEENCETISQTFSNSCFAEKAGAKEIKEGACE